MKTAVVFSGNLRTFFMPMRENPNYRVCDVLLENVVKSTNADVYVSTDTENFYLDGIQYFFTDDKNSPIKTLETYNFDQMRFHDNIKFIEYEDAYKLLEPRLKEFFGESLKSLIITKPYDATKDSKYELLKNNMNAGSIPEFIINQHRKSYLAYNEICKYEETNGKYHVIIKSRFDNLIVPAVNLSTYDFKHVDLHIPFIKGPVYFDWSAIGNRKAMHHYLSMYENLGFTLERGQSWMHSCSKCGWTFIEETKENTSKPKCPYCNSFDGVISENVTMASEHHVCEMVKKENLSCAVAQNQTHIYRYNNSNKALDLNFLKSLKLGDVNLKSYTMDAVTEYKI